MKERLLELLKAEQLTPSVFADEIGVQRSSVSHILSGRNKPGYDFLQKILKKFKNVNANWLLNGDGNMFLEDSNNELFSPMENKTDISAEVPDIPQTDNKLDSVMNQAVKDEKNINKFVEKIIVFYNDGSFGEFHR